MIDGFTALDSNLGPIDYLIRLKESKQKFTYKGSFLKPLDQEKQKIKRKAVEATPERNKRS